MSVRLDGRFIGLTPLSNPIDAEPGARRIELNKPGFALVTRDVLLAPGASITLNINLDALPEPGELVVAGSVPTPDAVLLINGQNAGALPWSGTLPAGDYVLTLSSRQFSCEPESVRVGPKSSTRLTLPLTPLPGLLRVSARSARAAIRLDGRLIAEGSYAGEVAAGSHVLEVSTSDSAVSRMEITLRPGETLVLPGIEPAPDKAEDAVEAERFSGLYGTLGLFGLVAPQAGHGLFDCGPSTVNARCSVTPSYGGGVELQVGYAFLSGLIAPELFIIAPVDVSSATVEFPEAVSVADSPYGGVRRQEQYVFLRYGAGGGFSVRSTTKGGQARLTGALGFGIISQRMQYQYVAIAKTTVPDEADFRTDPVSYVSPIIVGDLGVLLGSTPGLKFSVGIQMMVEFQGRQTAPARVGQVGYEADIAALSVVRQPLRVPELVLADKPQFFFGPVLSLRAGS